MTIQIASSHPATKRLADFFSSLLVETNINDLSANPETRTVSFQRHGICHMSTGMLGVHARLRGGSALLARGNETDHDDVVFVFYLPTSEDVQTPSDPRLFAFKATASIPNDPSGEIEMQLQPHSFKASDPRAVLRAKMPVLFLDAWQKFLRDS